MKVTTFFLFAMFFQVSAAVFSQNSGLINLKAENESLKEILRLVEDQSNNRFLYNSKNINVEQKKSIDCQAKSIEEVLDMLFKGTDIKYRSFERTYVLFSEEKDRLMSAGDLSASFQQQQAVSGKVTDSGGSPLPGVTVVVKGTTQGTVTNSDGEYSLTNIPEDATLVFSFVGMHTQEIPVGSQTEVNVKMVEDIIGIEEVVAIGYGTVRKRDLTGSVASIDANVYQNQSMTQVTEMLAGTVAGLNTTQSTSAAGGASMEIRGRNSLNASTDPMIVLDGSIYYGSIRDINPMDIESIDILKDASSAAVFGAQAASGVILITTVKGKKGKPKINFSTQVGIANVTNEYKPYDASNFTTWRRDVTRTFNPGIVQDYPYYYDNPGQLPEGITLEQWRNASSNPQEDNTKEWLSRLSFYPIEVENYINGNTVDWFDEVVISGVRQKYDLSVNGGNDEITYYWSIDYQDNEGVIRGDEYTAIRSRLNLDYRPTKWLNVGVNTQFADRDEGSVQAGLGSMYRMSPYGSMYDEDGELKWYPNDTQYTNPFLNYFGQDRNRKVNSLFAILYANIRFPLDINYKISYQPRYNFMRDYSFWPSTIPAGGAGGHASRSEFSSFSWILDHIISWKKQLGTHNFDLTLLYSAEQNSTWTSDLENENFFPNEQLGYSGLQFGTSPLLSSNDTESSADAVMARLNYTWKDRYLITASVRRDGYSAFGKENPRAVFPALAVAWILSEEDFFNVDDIYQLKLRASWGRNGNRAIGQYAALAQLESTIYYDGTNTLVGVYNNSLANYNLRWEQTESLNFGVDLGMFGNRLNFTGEYYISNTVDLLMNRKLPEITGYSSVTSNLGKLENRGVNLTINSVNINKKDLIWRTNLAFWFNRNKIIKLFGDYDEEGNELPDYSNEWFPGHAIDHIWNYKTLGIWQVDEADAAAVYKLQPGDWKAEDVDGNDKFEALQDKQFIGYREPRYQLGLRNDFDFLKHFSLSLFFRADLGHLAAFNDAKREGTDTYVSRNTADFPYWTPDNPINDYPRMNSITNEFGDGITIYKPRSFVRLQDLSLSYKVPGNLLKRYGIDDVRIYGSARNLFYISDWPGWDPESLTNPMPKTYTLGFSLTL